MGIGTFAFLDDSDSEVTCTSEPTGSKLEILSCYILILMHTTIFYLNRRRYTLQSVTKVFRIFDPLAAQDNQLRNLIEDAILILLDTAIGPNHSRSRLQRRIPARS